jgi:hypothetical protein
MNCTKVCPKGLKAAREIASAKRMRAGLDVEAKGCTSLPMSLKSSTNHSEEAIE